MHRSIAGPEVAEALDSLVGRRVAVRRRLDAGAARARFTDVVGELTADGPNHVLVHTRGGVARVRRDSVVAVREVPPAVPRRASWAAVARLERLCADGWPAVTERLLGEWRLRASGGFTGRANCALAVGDPGVPVPDALEAARCFAAEHRVTPRVQVPADSPWERAVTEHGWVLDAEHPAGAQVAVLVAELAELAELAGGAGAPAAAPEGVELAVHDRPSSGWWALSADEPVTAAQRHVLTAPGPRQLGFGVALSSGRPVAAVRLAVVDSHLYLSRLRVADRWRRRGLGTALTAAGQRWAMARGARHGVLQVAERNAAALEFYRRLGFRPHHRYRYLRPPGS